MFSCLRKDVILTLRKFSVPNNKVIIHGHSLGTAIGVNIAKHLCEKGEVPLGLILEVVPRTNVYNHRCIIN